MPAKLAVLVVDDNEDFCQNVKDVLELQDYAVVIAGDGLQALLAVKQQDFALVLMDVRMPVMDGVETLQRLKEMAPHTPVIMVTAFTEEDRIKEALQAGACGAFRKPLDFDKLLVLMGQVLAR